jgi:hypothetical protein
MLSLADAVAITGRDPDGRSRAGYGATRVCAIFLSRATAAFLCLLALSHQGCRWRGDMPELEHWLSVAVVGGRTRAHPYRLSSLIFDDGIARHVTHLRTYATACHRTCRPPTEFVHDDWLTSIASIAHGSDDRLFLTGCYDNVSTGCSPLTLPNVCPHSYGLFASCCRLPSLEV